MTQDSIRSIFRYAIAYFFCILVVTMLDLLVIRVPNMIHTPSMAALIGAGVYFSLMKQVPRFGAITSLGVMMSLFFFLSGHFIWAALPNAVCALVADLLAHQGSYTQKSWTWTSYLVFSLGNIAPIATMWIAPDAYAAQLLARGKDQAYVDRVMIPATFQEIGGQILGILVCGLLGILLYQAYSQWQAGRQKG